jgi:mannose-1-phosphate guanylyltransferase
MAHDHLHALVMAGGSGTRFWPASRRSRPKQLLALAPGTDDTLLAGTIRRILRLVPPERILVVTGDHLLEQTRAAVAAFPGVMVVAEPVARNTAPCIGWGTALLARRDPDAIVMALPSDHHIENEAAFHDAVLLALGSAAEGPITTIGITPTAPETGYGHIEASDEVRSGVRRAKRFVEKPDRVRAEEYFRSGRFFWNSGMFFYAARAMGDAIRTHLPELAKGIARIEAAASVGKEAEDRETRAVFPELPNISIDYGVMERLDEVHVVPADFGWSDLGSWSVAWELGERDADGNVNPDGALLVDASGNLVRDLGSHASDRVVALVGVHDLCVIQTDDALLVMPRSQAQDVRKVVEALAKRGQTNRT